MKKSELKASHTKAVYSQTKNTEKLFENVGGNTFKLNKIAKKIMENQSYGLGLTEQDPSKKFAIKHDDSHFELNPPLKVINKDDPKKREIDAHSINFEKNENGEMEAFDCEPPYSQLSFIVSIDMKQSSEEILGQLGYTITDKKGNLYLKNINEQTTYTKIFLDKNKREIDIDSVQVTDGSVTSANYKDGAKEQLSPEDLVEFNKELEGTDFIEQISLNQK